MKIKNVILILITALISSSNIYGEIGFNPVNLEANGSGNIGITTIDVNGDNLDDIITIEGGESRLVWYKNEIDTINGYAQTFTRTIIDPNIDGQYLDATDIDNDNIPDIVCSVPSNDGKILLYRSTLLNDSIYWEKEIISEDFSGAHQVHLVDMDNDDDFDILAAAIGDKKIQWWEFDEVNNNWISHQIEENYEAQAVEFHDFNNDGYPDIVSGLMIYNGENSINIWYSNYEDSLTFEKDTLDLTVSGAHWFEIVDMNNDGLEDILCAGFFSNEIALWERNNNDDLTFTRKTPVSFIAAPLHVSTGDLDDDGNIEIITNNHIGAVNHNLYYYKKNEAGNYIQHLMKSYHKGCWQIVVFDCDRDTDLDIITGALALGNPATSGDLTLFNNNRITGINDNYELAITNYELKQNYPNPFNPVTKINYKLGITNYKLAEIVVYNTMGQMVWSSPVTRYGILPVTGSIIFNGSKFNSGIYYYSLIIDGKKIDTKSMLLMK